jgi:hypothetical protein
MKRFLGYTVSARWGASTVLVGSWLVTSLIWPFSVSAILNSTDFQMRGEGFTNGGGLNSSTDFKSYSAVGEQTAGKVESTDFDGRAGTNYLILANVPLAPTVSNDTGFRYNRLQVTLNINPVNSEDQTNGTLFAIQVAKNAGFTSGVGYVSASDAFTTTLSTADYQTYSNWGGGSGLLVTGLDPSTQYCFRMQAWKGDATGSEWGPSACASTIELRLGLSIAAGSCTPTTATVGGNSINFGTLAAGTPYTCTHTVTSSTNAESGFVTTLKGNQVGLTSSGNDIDAFAGSWTSPATWTAPPGTTPNTNTGYIGYTTDDTSITGSGDKFSGGTLWAALEATAREVSSATSAIPAGQNNTVSTRVQINTAQPSGSYGSLTITYETTGTY